MEFGNLRVLLSFHVRSFSNKQFCESWWSWEIWTRFQKKSKNLNNLQKEKLDKVQICQKSWTLFYPKIIEVIFTLQQHRTGDIFVRKNCADFVLRKSFTGHSGWRHAFNVELLSGVAFHPNFGIDDWTRTRNRNWGGTRFAGDHYVKTRWDFYFRVQCAAAGCSSLWTQGYFLVRGYKLAHFGQYI